MPKLELTEVTKALSKLRSGQVVDYYIVSTPKGLGTVLFSDEKYFSKIPVRLYDKSKILLKEDAIEVVIVVTKKKA
jgi:hypothetical protein